MNKNYAALKNQTEGDIFDLMATTHTNTTQVELDKLSSGQAKTAKHPDTGMLFMDMIYQPMLELFHYLKAHQFKNYMSLGHKSY